jgi:alpha-ketoglutarate-dependent taurine dioxygenase
MRATPLLRTASGALVPPARTGSGLLRAARVPLHHALAPRSLTSLPSHALSTTAAATAGNAPRLAVVSAAKITQDGGVRVGFSDGTAARFHAAWLRDHCRCPVCRHPVTAQRMVDTLALLAAPDATRLADVAVEPGTGTLRVTWGAQPPGFAHAAWEGGGGGAPTASLSSSAHTSVYPAPWLASHAYWAGDGERLPPPPREHVDPATDTRRRVLWGPRHFGVQPQGDADAATSASLPSLDGGARAPQPAAFPDPAFLPRVSYRALMGYEDDGGGATTDDDGGGGVSATAADALPVLPPGPSTSGQLTALRQLRDYGFTLVTDTPATMEGTASACGRIGPPRPTLYARGDGMWRTEVRPEDAAPLPGSGSGGSSEGTFNDTAYSTLALPAHTDGCYWADPPGLQAFHCLRADPAGGHSLLLDGVALAERLRVTHPATFAFFASVELPFHHTDGAVHLHQWRRVITLTDDGVTVAGFNWNNDDRAPLTLRRYAPLRLAAATLLQQQGGGSGGKGGGGGAPSAAATAATSLVPSPDPSLVRAFYRTHLPVLLAALRDPAAELWLPLRPGGLLLFDNTRVLHGRSAFRPSSRRVLAGCYVSREDWHGALRALSAASGADGYATPL